MLKPASSCASPVVDVGDPHPNTYRLSLKNARETHTLIAISTGGGMIEVTEIDGLPLHMDGGYHEKSDWYGGDPNLVWSSIASGFHHG